MGTRGRLVYRLLLRLVPRTFREAAGSDLEAAAAACVARERARRGRLGAAIAWLRLAADVLITGLALRVRPPDAVVASRFGRPGPAEPLMDTLHKDLVYALRGLRRQPGFAVVTILTLALGIGANTAIFSVVNGVLLRPLPYPEPERLQFITGQFPADGVDKFWISPPEFLEFRDHNASFSSVGAYTIGAANLGADPPSRPVVAAITPDLLPTLGVRPLLGRWFTPADAVPGASAVAILSNELWVRTYGSDVGVVGRRVLIDDIPTEIVGVMPSGFDIHDQHVELWAPMGWTPAALAGLRGRHFLYLVGRLKAGVTLAQARADLARMLGHWQDLAEVGWAGNLLPSLPSHPLQIAPLKEEIVGGARTSLFMLLGAVTVVLLIACANLANLLLARAEGRQREFAVRTALGASRWRMLSQLVTEGLVLTSIGAAIGIGLAELAVKTLLSVDPDALPQAASIGLDWRVLTFTLVLATTTGLVLGVAPLMHLGGHLASALRDGTRATGGRLQKFVREFLAVGEVTMAVILVIGAGLLMRSFVNLLQVDLGFNRSHLVTCEVAQPVARDIAPEARVAENVRVVGTFNELRDRLAVLPGVRDVTEMSGLPPNREVDANDTDFEWIPDVRDPNPTAPTYPRQNVDYWQYVGHDYVETMGIPVLEGRAFRDSDAGGPPVVLVNETLAKKFFYDRDPIGQRLKRGFGADIPWFRIVGVVKDVKQGGVGAPAGTEIDFLLDQVTRLGVPTEMHFVLRTTAPVDALAGPMRSTARTLDASLAIVKLETMDDVVDTTVARPRFLLMLLWTFAGLALLLAAVGTYGVLSYVVTHQRQEIGIRMALGADRPAILRHFLARGLALFGIGFIAGLAGSIMVTRLVQSLLFNVTPTDPLTFALVAAVIAVVALAACLVPAWRATRVDPLAVLRSG